MRESLSSRATRRVVDVAASGFGIVVLAPLMSVIAAWIKHDSPGPIVFTQERIGRGGRPFVLHKFRTMRTASDGPLVTVGGDNRVTAVGRRLRATKLDELPQLLNVLRGDMSLVGPRPEVRQYVELWPAEERSVILSVRPGITDPFTLELRREEELLQAQPDPDAYYREVLLPQKAWAYSSYVQNRTLLGDLLLTLRTVAEVLRG